MASYEEFSNGFGYYTRQGEKQWGSYVTNVMVCHYSEQDVTSLSFPQSVTVSRYPSLFTSDCLQWRTWIGLRDPRSVRESAESRVYYMCLWCNCCIWIFRGPLSYRGRDLRTGYLSVPFEGTSCCNLQSNVSLYLHEFTAAFSQERLHQPLRFVDQGHAAQLLLVEIL